MMKIIRLKKTKISSGPDYRTPVITEDSLYYYFYDKNNCYSRIARIEENRLFTINSLYKGGAEC